MALRSKKRSTNTDDKKMKMKKIKEQQQQKDGSLSSSRKEISQVFIDHSVTMDTLKTLGTILANECTRKIFYEFTEREFSANHVSFYFEARAYRDSYIMVAPNTSAPEAQQQPERIPELAEVSSSRRHSHSPSSSMMLIETQQQGSEQQPISVEVATTRSGSVVEVINISSDGANKVSRESSAMEIEMTESLAEQKNLESASKLFEKYLSPNSPIEVNLDYRTFSEINKRIQSKQISEKLFDRAIKEIYDIINNDSFHRFKQSPIFSSIIRQCTEKQESLHSSSSSTSINTDSKKKKRRSFFCMG